MMMPLMNRLQIQIKIDDENTRTINNNDRSVHKNT